MDRTARSLATLLILLVLAFPGRAMAGARLTKQCRRTCGTEIARCTDAAVRAFETSHPGTGGRRLRRKQRLLQRRCKRQVTRRCRREGLGVCLPPTTTTTTTRPPVFTTTTTTLPATLNVAGIWAFSGVLVDDPCGIYPFTFNSTLQIAQSGIFLSGTIGSVAASGQVTGPDSFVFASDVFCVGTCCGAGAVAASNVRNVGGVRTAAACLAYEAVCLSGVSCPAAWCGGF